MSTILVRSEVKYDLTPIDVPLWITSRVWDKSAYDQFISRVKSADAPLLSLNTGHPDDYFEIDKQEFLGCLTVDTDEKKIKAFQDIFGSTFNNFRDIFDDMEEFLKNDADAKLVIDQAYELLQNEDLEEKMDGNSDVEAAVNVLGDLVEQYHKLAVCPQEEDKVKKILVESKKQIDILTPFLKSPDDVTE